MNKQHVGFPTLEEFSRHALKEAPVNVYAITEAGKFGQHGMCMVNSTVMVSQVAGAELLYVSIAVSRFESQNGRTPLFADIPGQPDHPRLAKQAFDIITAWLTEQGFAVRNAVVARPRNLKLLEGRAGCMTYSKEQGYTRWPASPRLGDAAAPTISVDYGGVQ